jgi:hypothetical protein
MELLPSFARSRIFNNSRFLSPIYFWRFYCNSQRSNKILNLICSIPALYHCRLSKCFRRIGIKSLFGSAILTVLTFWIIVACFWAFAKECVVGTIFCISYLLLCKAHSESGYEYGKAKSNSLLYLYNADTGKANWATYDKISIRGRKVT